MSDVFAKNVATSAQDAAHIVPRAEFRVFGHGIIELVKSRMWNGKTVLQQARRMPPETYFLSAHTDAANVKVRDSLLDIKTRISLTPQGYEIFQPAGKFQFPASSDTVQQVCQHLQANVVLDQPTYDIDAFIAIARKHSDLCPVSVEKMRYGFTVNGVVCEYAQVWFNGALMETACVESENYAGMQQVIEGLGIHEMANTNYLKAAKMVVGMV